MGRRLVKAVFALAVCAMASLPLFAEKTITQTIKLSEDTDWTASGTVNLSDGVVVDLNGHDLRVSGLAGSGRFISTEELIANGSFEEIEGNPTGTSNAFKDSVHPKDWTAVYLPGIAAVGYANSKDKTWSNGLDAQDGGRSVYLYCKDNASGGASLTQMVNVVRADIYRLSFYTAYRPGYSSDKNMRIYVDVDGETLGYAVCSTETWAETAFEVQLDAGEHHVTFRNDGTGASGNPSGLLDNVSLRPLHPRCALRLAYAAGASYSCQNVSLDGIMPIAESLTLDGDCDWRGLGIVYMDDGANLDLAGHNLSADGISYGAELVSNGFGITNSNDGVTSELRINVGSGNLTNDIVPIGGNIKFVKDGKGTFVSAMAQTYTGGTVIAAGTAQPKDPANQNSTETSGHAFKAFGTGPITVSEGAVFDFRANYAYCAYDIQLDGGTLANTKWNMTHGDWSGVGIGALTKDSYMNVPYSTVLGDGSGTIDLGAHRLSVAVPTANAVLNVRYPTINNGTLAVSGGWLRFDVACNIDARLEVDCALGLRADIRVRDYVVGNDASAASSGSLKKLEVYGKFIPNTDKFYGCTMLDKSTIDLSGRATALPAKSALPSTNTFPNSITFEDGATVTVHVDGRTDLNELSRTKAGDAYAGYLMKWDKRPDASVRFVLDGDAARKYSLACTDAGLVLCPHHGFMILFR